MKKTLLATAMLLGGIIAAMAQGDGTERKLTGTVIGTSKSMDYDRNTASTKVNTRDMAFDGDVNTYFASYERSYTWVGLDLGQPHVITRIGWCPANRSQGNERIVLGVFEGSNSPDFMDALPLYIIPEKGTYRVMTYTDVSCSKGFRYVRYVGPSDQRCNIAEIEFYGHEGEGDESAVYRLTNLPTVSIHTENNVEPYDKEHNIVAIVTIISDKGKAVDTDSATVRQRGNYSVNFPKKPYRIKFNKKERVLDAPAKAKKWTLLSNYSDKTLMRNLLAFELSRCMGMPYTPYGQAVDLLLNGEYKGCYQLCDHVDVNKNRVNLIDTLAVEDPNAPVSTAFLVEVDAGASSEASWFMSARNNPVTIHYPDDDDITEEQYAYIKSKYNLMEQLWRNYLDLNTFLRHFLVGELSGNTDTYWSTYMYKHRENDTIFTGPVWDFDLAFENDDRTYPINSKSDYVYRSGGSNAGNMKWFVDNIVVNNKPAKAKMLDIWGKMRHGLINEEHLIGYINEMEDSLQQSQKLNFTRWPNLMNEYVHQNPVIWGSYEAEVQNVRRYLSERLLWMDNKLGYTYEPDGIANISLDMSQPYKIYSLSGQPCQGSLQTLPKGIYIVRQGQASKTVQVR